MRGHIGSIGLRESRLTCMLHAVIRKIVGTRAETLVDEQNHNCSPILSIAFVFFHVVVCVDVSWAGIVRQFSAQ